MSIRHHPALGLFELISLTLRTGPTPQSPFAYVTLNTNNVNCSVRQCISRENAVILR